MLNPTFSVISSSKIVQDYVAPSDIAQLSLNANTNFETGIEYRLQSVYGDEIWLKLEKAGFTHDRLNKLKILEVCAGNGFLTYHLLKRINPAKYVINDISIIELEQNRILISENFENTSVEYLAGDVHTLNIEEKFDLVIGNSFLHHFHDVPRAFKSILTYLKPGGTFISLHEPTPLSPVVEGAKIYALPLGIIFPTFLNNLIRRRYNGPPSETDLWQFEESKLKRLLSRLGVVKSHFYYWNLFRPIAVQKNALHLSMQKPFLNDNEVSLFEKSILRDAFLNKFLPSRFFGSMCIVVEK